MDQKTYFNHKTQNLSFIDLKYKSINDELLKIIPNHIALKYSAIFFAEDDNSLSLALGNPEKLKKDLAQPLEKLAAKLGKKVSIYQSDPQVIKTIIQKHFISDKTTAIPSKPVLATLNKLVQPKTISEPPPKSSNLNSTSNQLIESAGNLPKLYIQGEIPYEVFKRVPYFFCQLHQIVCIDFIPPNIYHFATPEPKLSEIQTILSYIKVHNHIQLKIFQANKRELEYLLIKYKKVQTNYQQSVLKVKKDPLALFKNFSQKPELKKPVKPIIPIETKESPKPDLTIKEEKLAKGVIKPDVQGAIITSEKEKSGIANTFEKLSSFFSSNRTTDITDDKSLPSDKPQEEKPADKLTAIAQETETGLKPELQVDLNLKTALGQTPSSSALAPLLPKPALSLEEKQLNQIKEEKKEDKMVEVKRGKDEAEKNDSEKNTLGKLLAGHDIETLDELKSIVKENNIPKIVAAIISYAITLNASDIHLEPFEDEFLIRYRIDGQLRNVIKLPPDMHAPMISRIKILSKLKLDETRIPQDGRFDVVFLTREVDLRVSTMPAVHGEKGVLRILDKSKGIISLESLGVLGRGFDLLIESINKPYGIIMATGPTGSGKSTTLYAILSRVATSNVNVITLEDPVEYEMKGVNQSQINPKIGYTFADGLRSILRQDPNIIMVGEVRDGETANMATQAALTGHLVLTTLHTNDASGALPRLINMGIEPFLITSSVNVIIGQRLVRKICSECKQEVSLPDGVIKTVEAELAKIPESNPKDRERIRRPFKFYEGKGCSKCNNSGYSGRVGVYEILSMSEKIEELTIEQATANQLLDQAAKEGMITMKQDGILKVLAGITTLDEVLKETSNNLELRIKV